MLLRLSSTSPFARKVRLAAAVIGVPLELEIADALDPADSLRQQNPLGKIPTLVTDEGETLYDSSVIAAYLDILAGGDALIPAEPKARIATLKGEALADGLMDAGILLLYEGRFRPAERHEPKWLEHQRGKVARGFAFLEANVPAVGEKIRISDIALACALGFFDFRFEGAWQKDHPRLLAWREAFAQRCPNFAETAPKL